MKSGSLDHQKKLMCIKYVRRTYGNISLMAITAELRKRKWLPPEAYSETTTPSNWVDNLIKESIDE